MRIYFYFSVFEPLLVSVARRLERIHAVTIVGGFVWGRDQRAKMAAPSNWRIDIFSEWLLAAAQEPDLAYLRAAEKRYGLPNLAMIAYADRTLAGWSNKQVLRALEASLRNWEELFERERPDAIIFESIDALATVALFAVARSHGTRTLVMDAGRVWGRVAIQEDSHVHRWPAVERAFESLRMRGLSRAEREEAEEFVRGFRAARPANKYLHGPPGIRRSDAAAVLRAAWRQRIDPANITAVPAAEMVRSRVRRLVRSRLAPAYFSRSSVQERYVLFPLQFQPETTTLVCAPFAVDQPSFVESIARCIPVDHRLYVKEHRTSIGRRPLGDYRRISRSWNVRLIDPMAEVFGLIQNASAVLAITSTMGWEAILLDRPVVTFGEVFYNTYPLVRRASAFPQSEWPSLVASAIDTWRPDSDVLLTYVAAVLAGTFAVDVLFDNPRTRPAVMDPDNISRITDVFARALGSGSR